MQKITLGNKTYAFVDMRQDYPFGLVQQATEHTVLVRKNLVFQQQHQLKIIQKMSEILSTIQHQHLVAFVQAQLNQKNTCSFYYQYVPLTIDKWLLDLGQDVVEQLEFQVTSLAGYLAGNGIKFTFDPKCMGLSKDIKIKYFLKEFSIDNENKLTNYKDNEKKISNFFQQLKQPQQQNSEQLQKSEGDRNASYGSVRKVDSFQTRESWDIKSCKSDNSNNGNSKEYKNKLAERLQDTKKKSLELLARMKGLKSKN